MHPLTSKQRANLRARAHELHPVVQVGHAGLTPAVLSQIDGALTAHELIKIKLGKESPLEIEQAATEVSAESRAQVVQKIGRVIVVFRRNPEQPKIALKVGAKGADGKEANPGIRKSGRQLTRNRKPGPPRHGAAVRHSAPKKAGPKNRASSRGGRTRH